MTKTKFRKDGWDGYFAQFEEDELVTIVMWVTSMLDANMWEPAVDYFTYQRELAREESSGRTDPAVRSEVDGGKK